MYFKLKENFEQNKNNIVIIKNKDKKTPHYYPILPRSMQGDASMLLSQINHNLHNTY